MTKLKRQIIGACMVAALALALPAVTRANEKVYDKTLPGTVWIKASLASGQTSFGSGVLIDQKRRWVVTNYHVVENQDNVRVFFPAKDKTQVVAERQYYLNNETKLAIPGKVITRNPRKDLAVIQLSRLPKGATAIPVSKLSPRSGQDLHVVGNPRGGALWVYTEGTVRQVYNKRWNVRLGNGRVLFLDARVVETSLAINPGDSGGPVVNNDNQLVALVSSYQKDQRLVSTCIDISEIHTILQQADKGVKVVQSGSSPATPVVPAKAKVDNRVKQLLDQSTFAGKFKIMSNGGFQVRVDSRSPVHVYIDSFVDTYKNLSVRRVWAVGKLYKNAPPADLLMNLLKTTATRRIGAWEVRLVKDQYWIVFCHRLHLNATDDELESAIRFVFLEADDLDLGKLAFGTPKKLPPVVGQPGALAGSTWTGTENLQGYGKLGFEFQAAGKAVMIDSDGRNNGVWQQNGKQVTLSFHKGTVIYTGVMNGDSFSGSAQLASGKNWTFSLKRSQ